MIEKIGPWLFVHGGISPAVNRLPHTLAEINDLARANYTSPKQAFTPPLQPQLFNESDSPFYYQGYYDGTVTSDQINTTLTKFGVHTIITGYSLQPEAISYFGGKVINVNIDPKNGNAKALFIMHKHIYSISKEGKREK
ncbi:hypothetical protein [Paraflavitalea speifideaquila]|uniref:hypothetical protein n=1 Tax=Paraflavitalea speifideaquila TaxID=3076558 RepID=UPI0028EF08F2|nr:hypothetical protein [Paraflavitalea speifideiaquila]